MKLTQKIQSRNKLRPFYTFEFFPPRTDQGFENLISRISRLATLDPLAISVTWGAGGSTKERSLDLAGLAQAEYGLDTVLHLTCTNMEQGLVDDVLRTANERGIQNVLALRGDPPRGEEEWIPSDPRFAHGIDLVSYIRSSSEFSSHFCIGVAAYPDGHTESTVDEATELDYLKAKVDAGADFIVTQLFYDVDRFLQWLEKARQKGINVPIIPGIMPIQTHSSFARLTKLCGTRVPEDVAAALNPISHDDQLVKDYGVKLAIDMIQRITADGKVPGVHFCTLNLEKSVQRVLEGLQWVGGVATTSPNKLIAETPDDIVHPPSDVDSSTLLVTPTTATAAATTNLTTVQITEEAGRGELNNAATWDDFPNGRFGDFKSPAFGNQDPWGGSGISRTEVLAQWGSPKTLENLTKIFVDHLHSRISTTPFSPGPLSPESLMILPHLEKLTKKGWWTVGSQPAVDGASSSDPVVGWGPRSGYVFQKGFVEFFCPKEDLNAIERRVEEKGNGWVHWFAGSDKGECRSNVPKDGRNAVTWGVFPGQEIAQTTIIEKESFLSWKEEAFSIWSEWASFYRPDSEQRKLLEDVRDQRWLVSIVHHDYKDPQALWTFLFDDDDDIKVNGA
ncbi:methylenetetrahydrofolate reductase-domain-containing protein [Crucibulum laeve]|uniref:Methylenetetrahydrofolate reductase-domain-containing protein n=1 Tax=Crucibulum laeve TaxID=68775 RepID=A0A5C3MMK2_9AGAR|nr:methylenetetrahydrofolate reductase-domain-containing protein [Crucibulum laeve]